MKLIYSVSAGILLLAVLALGIYGMGRSLWLDEAWVANSIQEPSLAAMFDYPGWLQTSPPLFLLLARASVRVLGASNVAFRVVPLLLALAAAAGMLAVSRRLLRPSLALLATAVVAFDPTAIEYSRTLKPYSGELAATALLLLAAVRYLQQPDRPRYLWLLAAVAVAMPLAYSAVFLVPGIVFAIWRSGQILLLRDRPVASAQKWQVTDLPHPRRDLSLFNPASPEAGLSRDREGATMGLLPTNGDEKHAKGRMPGERSVAPSVIFNRAVLAALAAGILLAMYWLSIRPNLAPELRAFWAVDADRGMTAGLWFALIFCVAAAIRAGLRRDWPMIVCLLPCLLLAASGALGWYPVSHRTRLFALPCFTLAVMMTVEDLLRRWSNRTAINVAALALAIGIAGYAASAQVIERRAVPEEDFAAAVRFLESHVQPGDLVLVHACCKEGFLLYSAMDAWNPPRVLYGDTGWPCCARGKDARPGLSTERAVIADLDAKIPRGYSGRIWLLFTTRPTHWSYVGIDEGELWRKHLWERGCPPGPYLRFENLAVSPMDCMSAR